jgi:hypothetical protein
MHMPEGRTYRWELSKPVPTDLTYGENPLVTILCALVQIVVLADELLQLALHIYNLLGWKLEFYHGNLGFFQIFKEANFVGQKKHEGASLGVGSSSCTSDTVNVVPGVIRRIELHDPINALYLNRM